MARQDAFSSSASPAKVSRMSFLSEWKSPRRAPGLTKESIGPPNQTFMSGGQVWRGLACNMYILITRRRLCGYILVQHQNGAAALILDYLSHESAVSILVNQCIWLCLPPEVLYVRP